MDRIISEILYMEQTKNLPLETILHTVLSQYDFTPKKSNELITTDESWHGVLVDYLKRATIKGLRPKTIEHYKEILARALETMGKPIRDITSTDISLYLAYLKNMRNASPRYMDGVRVIMNGFFSWCAKSRIIDYNPVDAVDKIKYVKKKVRPFSEEEMEKLRRACEKTKFSVRNRALLETLYSSGLRCDELIQLNIDDIDIEKHEGFVRDGKGGKQGDFMFSDVAGLYLKQYLESRTDKDPALFLSKNNQRFRDDTSVEHVLSQLGDIAGVRGVRPHRLRHTFIQRCIDKGMSIQDVMKAVRHASISTTEEYYIANMRRTKEEYGRVFN